MLTIDPDVGRRLASTLRRRPPPVHTQPRESVRDLYALSCPSPTTGAAMMVARRDPISRALRRPLENIGPGSAACCYVIIDLFIFLFMLLLVSLGRNLFHDVKDMPLRTRIFIRAGVCVSSCVCKHLRGIHDVSTFLH
eukprot:GHVU01013870.1.p2 GENE.GHVU01013870.1~~GHVU01013870.1.p2  ORF type:complete len:138 (+),score=2.09 GHVU01013870.1:486-899(+)